jgi:hypothetical protein
VPFLQGVTGECVTGAAAFSARTAISCTRCECCGEESTRECSDLVSGWPSASRRLGRSWSLSSLSRISCRANSRSVRSVAASRFEKHGLLATCSRTPGGTCLTRYPPALQGRRSRGDGLLCRVVLWLTKESGPLGRERRRLLNPSRGEHVSGMASHGGTLDQLGGRGALGLGRAACLARSRAHLSSMSRMLLVGVNDLPHCRRDSRNEMNRSRRPATPAPSPPGHPSPHRLHTLARRSRPSSTDCWNHCDLTNWSSTERSHRPR